MNGEGIMVKTLPAQSRLQELFDPKSGVLTWRVSNSKRVKVGQRAGAARPCGRRVVSVDGVRYREHRIIWKLVTGEEPAAFIDHRDIDGGNNRWENLRTATNSQNMANRGVQSNSSSGLKWAYFHAASGRWLSRIQKDGVDYPLGYWPTAEAAHAAGARKAAELFGEFARAA